MDPVGIDLFGIPGIVFLWIAMVIAFTIFGRRIAAIVRVLLQAKPEKRFDSIPKRVINFFVYVLGQKKLFLERAIGLIHFLIFYGFIFFALAFGWNTLRGLFPFLPIPYADEVGIMALLLELFGVFVFVSILVAAFRRIFFPPPHLQQSFDAAIILTLIGVLMISFLVGQGFHTQLHGQSTWTPVGNFLGSSVFPQVTEAAAKNWLISMWWAHTIIVLIFLIYLPYSKHMHLLASPFNVFFSNIHKYADLTKHTDDEGVYEGASKWNEFTWKDLLNCFADAECGRCERACPALNSGYQLAPRNIIHQIKTHLFDTSLLSGKKDGSNTHTLIGDLISADELWECTTCMACMEVCPVLIEHIPVIVSMRRSLVTTGEMDQSLQETLEKINRYGNSFGQSGRMRAKWTNDLNFKIKDARKEKVEYLWLVGDYASFDPRLKNITIATANIFKNAGVDFGILYDGEKNFGNDVRRIGEEGLFEILREDNLKVLQKAKFEKIVTTDPHSLNTLKNEYDLDNHINHNGKANGSTHIPVMHYTELIDELIKKGVLNVSNPNKNIVTYHDPCYLGRYNGIYEQPRRILRWLGAKIVEMARNRKDTYCCGAGGGRIWMEDKTTVKERPSESRIREAVSLDNVKTLVVACPKDLVMYQDAVKTTGCEEKIDIKDIAELVWAAIQSEAVEPPAQKTNDMEVH